ncbi:MAG: hypothetical protein WBG92_17740 [Thiohalocapsa sp.]
MGALRALFPDPADAILIGARLAERFPQQPEKSELLGDTGLDLSWPVDRMLMALRSGRARDFETGRTVELDGWTLARCEAALCRLLALEYPRC